MLVEIYVSVTFTTMSDVMKRFIDNDRFAEAIGVEITDYGAGTAKARLELTEKHLNSAGTAHGGLIFSLADAVFSVASNSHGTLAMAINVSISFFKAVREGVLTAEGREISFNHLPLIRRPPTGGIKRPGVGKSNCT